MIVQRIYWSVKPECAKEAVAWFKALKWPKPLRLQWPHSAGTFDVLAVEADYESMAEHERIFDQFWARPDSAGLMAELHGLLDGKPRGELWRTID